MAKYTKNFASMVGETNGYWGKDGLVQFVESFLGPADREDSHEDKRTEQSTGNE